MLFQPLLRHRMRSVWSLALDTELLLQNSKARTISNYTNEHCSFSSWRRRWANTFRDRWERRPGPSKHCWASAESVVSIRRPPGDLLAELDVASDEPDHTSRHTGQRRLRNKATYLKRHRDSRFCLLQADWKKYYSTAKYQSEWRSHEKLFTKRSFNKWWSTTWKHRTEWAAFLPLISHFALLSAGKAPTVKATKPLEFDRQFQEQKRSQKLSSEALVFPTKE